VSQSTTQRTSPILQAFIRTFYAASAFAVLATMQVVTWHLMCG
jgi:hypothetical protein